MWLGPGSEKVWQYDRRNPPIKWQPRADEFMNIIREAGHPIYIYTGAIPLAKGKLMNEGRTEHFTKDYHNERMLIKLIYDSNMLTAFLALWKHVPQQRQMASPSVPKASSKKAAGGYPMRTSDARQDSGKGPKLAAGARSEVKTPDLKIEAGIKRRSAEEVVGPIKRKRVKRGEKQIHKKAMPENLNYFLYKQIEKNAGKQNIMADIFSRN